jgi:ATP-dependent Clp protease ATP-binding subunit ClpB
VLSRRINVLDDGLMVYNWPVFRCPSLAGFGCPPRARRRFTPEFMNRLDQIVVFRALGEPELRQIVDIELNMVRQRIETAAVGCPFVINVTPSAKEFLLLEGTDFQYGARPLKRAIERLLVQPLSNLLATGQIRRGDRVRVSHADGSPVLMFYRDADALGAWGTSQAAA